MSKSWEKSEVSNYFKTNTEHWSFREVKPRSVSVRFCLQTKRTRAPAGRELFAANKECVVVAL